MPGGAAGGSCCRLWGRLGSSGRHSLAGEAQPEAGTDQGPGATAQTQMGGRKQLPAPATGVLSLLPSVRPHGDMSPSWSWLTVSTIFLHHSVWLSRVSETTREN